MKLFEQVLSYNNTIKTVTGLTDELKGLYLTRALKETKQSILLVTNSLYEANKLYQVISDFTADVELFPMDDFLTSEALAISPELKITRLETLKTVVSKDTPKIVVTNLMGYLRFLPKKDDYEHSFLSLHKNQEIEMKQIIEFLYHIGYQRETVISKTGEMAVRGFVIDIFPLGEKMPIRIEFWGDTIESIRIFDIDSQLTIKKIDTITIEPNSEFLVHGDVPFEEQKQKYLVKYAPVTNIGGYLGDYMTVYLNYLDIKNGYELLLDEMFHYSSGLDIPGDTVYMNELEKCIKEPSLYLMDFDNIIDNVNDTHTYQTYDIPMLSGTANDIYKQLKQYQKENKIVVICLRDRYQINKILETYEQSDFIFTDEENIISDKINLIVKPLKMGFGTNTHIVISERELFHKDIQRMNYKTNFKFGTKIRDITKLSLGDYIVHQVHGIGRYCGIQTLLKNGLKKDYLTLEYKNSDKVYIPVEKIEMITKYSSNDGIVPKLNKLGGTDWEKTKLRVRKKIEDIAGDLLKLYAAREASEGYPFDKDNEDQIAFEREFSYTETVDQLKVTEEIKKDMERARPMDRLLCGDVGFGKTEVAFRAIFKAIISGKQVALLCPTTILSTQHYKNAIERFQSYPIRIGLLNRFVSPKEVKRTLTDVALGKIDLLIGTHRILSEDIKFKNMGLLVIDEEQRFGVKHKEKIKQYKTNVDVLTLSATPIPRTLQMSMAGLRSLSLIETPPVNRYPIQTYVLAENKPVLKDVIYKEISRGGQVFILYNHIDKMNQKLHEISRLVPDARVISAHGQMNKKELEDVMIRFINHEFDVLLCTTIIETGIDIPSVNTLIIIDADRFGLSQLYQIRGRVGRSNKIAYCYLMYQSGKVLSEIAIKRLKVIKDFTELGSGFAIAMRDLSIRGAGDILGSEQAGFIDTIGIELFMKMLNEEISRLKGIPVAEEENISSQPLLDVETSIGDHYVSEEELKIEIHQKINQIDSYEKLHSTKIELEDRFGKLDESLIIYMYEEWFEKLASEIGLKRIRQTKNSIELIVEPELTEKINGELLFMEANRISRMFRFQLRGRCLIVTLDTVKLEKHFVYYLIEFLEIMKKAIS